MATETGGVGPSSSLWTGLFIAIGFVLVIVGYAVRGLDVGTCPVMGYNGIISGCIHTFPGTDIPITPTGNMVMIIGGVLVLTTLVLTLYALVAPKIQT